MNKKSIALTHALAILFTSFAISGCSSDNSSGANGNEGVFTNNGKSPLILDSISSCIINPDSIEGLIALNKIYLKYFDGTWRLTFPANINDLRDNYTIATRSANDTLIVSMKRKKESTAVPGLACPVLVYTSLKRELEENYLAAMGAYSIIRYDENFVTLDSISDCILDEQEINKHYSSDTAFVEEKNGKNVIVFPSQLDYPRKYVKSIGAFIKGDTLQLDLLDKEKPPETPLFCPIKVYGTLNKPFNGKFVSTRSGVYVYSSI